MFFSSVYVLPYVDKQVLDMANNNSSILFSLKVKFSRESPNDFYVSGDRVQGIIQLVTNKNENDLINNYGPLRVELIGELNDFVTNKQRTLNPDEIQRFFRKRAQVKRLPNDNQQLEINGLRSYRWVFDGLLNFVLPSSLPPDDDCDPCIFYYARVYFNNCPDAVRIFAFVVFTQTPISLLIGKSNQNYDIEGNIQHKGVNLRGILSNNGLVVPGQTLVLQIKIDNPLKIIIKSIRATLKQYRHIVNAETNFIIFSFNLPGFQPDGFNSEYRQSTYELPIPLEKCRIMAPTSSFNNVRYELQIQCHIHRLFNSHFTLTLPVICTTDHQQTLKIMDELKSLPEILPSLSTREEEKPPPTYADFIASVVLPKYEDIIY